MYGFNKVNAGANVVSSVLGQSATDTWEFKHPEFQRGRVESLYLIKRKSSKSSGGAGATGMLSKTSSSSQVISPEEAGVASGSKQQSDQQLAFLTSRVRELEDKLEKLHESHSLLWSETVACRMLQSKHHQVIGNAISFLSSIYKEEEGAPTESGSQNTKTKKRKLEGML